MSAALLLCCYVCVLGLGAMATSASTNPIPFCNLAHLAKLSDASLRHSMLAQTDRRPTYGLTMGMADLMHAQQILLLVSGPTKRAPLGRLLNGPVSTEFRASMLTLHANAIVLCDQESYAEFINSESSH